MVDGTSWRYLDADKYDHFNNSVCDFLDAKSRVTNPGLTVDQNSLNTLQFVNPQYFSEFTYLDLAGEISCHYRSNFRFREQKHSPSSAVLPGVLE